MVSLRNNHYFHGTHTHSLANALISPLSSIFCPILEKLLQISSICRAIYLFYGALLIKLDRVPS